ncbi:YncE family protein [Massilia sp. LXY-6]|uniref:YncE family protein n=1 Tax=Massilia sp. LXY-6 TaxID=3379823 RepID=UPI003EE33844
MANVYSFARRLVPTIGAVLMLTHAPQPGTAALPTQRPLLQQVGDYPLPGHTTRWDYMAIDPDHAKLVLAHLGDSTVVVVDSHTKSVLGQVKARQVHGVLAVPELGRIYATATGNEELLVIDEADLSLLARVPVGRYPDGLTYAGSAGKVYVSDKEGNTESVIDVRTDKRIATIELGGTVGNSQYDQISGHVFINVEGTSELVEVDPATDRVVSRTRLPNAEGNHGLLIEPTLRLAFVACEGNDKLIVLDLRNRRVTARFDVAGEPDVLAYDAELGILYVATESGPVHLFRVRAGAVDKMGEVRVGPNAHTVAVDPVSHEVYFPLRQAGGRPVLRVMRPVTQGA